jgi:putative transposase
VYSYEDRMKAVKLYIQYDKSAAAVIHELGYPNRHSLVNWYEEFLKNNDLKKERPRPQKFSNEQKETAVNYYMEHGKCVSRAIRALGYPSRTLLKQWIRERYPEELPRCYSKRPLVYSTKEQKEAAVLELCQRDKTVDEIASENNVSREAIYLWANEVLGKGSISSVPKKNKNREEESSNVEELQAKVDSLKKQAKKLQEEVFRLRIEKDVIEKAAEVIKKDQGVSLSSLTNQEKVIVIDALRNVYSLKELLSVLHMSKSSYFYQETAMSAPDKYAQIRGMIKQAFNESSNRYGYRRIHDALKNESVKVSEKVVRRLMKADGLIVKCKRRRKYSSYAGEITPAVPNLIERNFHADKPNMKWLTDITEFIIPAGKVYLSPMIDCFDGLPVAWTIGTSPNAELVNTMLDNAIATLNPGEKPIIHSDRGCHYRWPDWIKRMDESGLTRSMSKKGCSPDNSACEGFFGRLKNEMFYCRSWENVTIDEFINEVDKYMHWYAEKRIKHSLGGLSPIEYRRKLGLIA